MAPGSGVSADAPVSEPDSSSAKATELNSLMAML
jgi:hypothetical protein